MKYNYRYSLLFLRLLLGNIFFWQGYGKVFRWGINNVYQNIFSSYESGILPIWLLKLTAYFTSFGELICGALLILGLFRKWAYLVLAIILLVVSFGHGLKDPIWDLSHVLYRAILLLPLIFLPRRLDTICIDNYFQNNNSKI